MLQLCSTQSFNEACFSPSPGSWEPRWLCNLLSVVVTPEGLTRLQRVNDDASWAEALECCLNEMNTTSRHTEK